MMKGRGYGLLGDPFVRLLGGLAGGWVLRRLGVNVQGTGLFAHVVISGLGGVVLVVESVCYAACDPKGFLMDQFAAQWISQYGYIALFSLLMLGIVGVPIPDEWVLTFAGYLIFKNDLRFVPTFFAVAAGSMCGITLSYGLGRNLGLDVLEKHGRKLHITISRVNAVHRWFQRIGRWVLVFGYFVPGVRHLAAYLAGSARMPIAQFAAYAYSGGVIWSLTFLAIGYFVADEHTRVAQQFRWISTTAVLVITVSILAYRLIRNFTRRRRSDS